MAKSVPAKTIPQQSPAVATGSKIPNGNDERQALIDASSPVYNTMAEAALKETTISDIERSSAWAELQLEEFREIIGHRKNWSDGLLFLIGMIVLMDIVVILYVGAGLLIFENSLAVPAFIGSTLLAVYGLANLVVRFLFPTRQPREKRPQDD